VDPSASSIRATAGQQVWLAKDMMNDTIRIPAWWHDAIVGVGQQFESVKEVRLAVIYFFVAKKFMYEFVKNETRITALCKHKE